MDEKETEVYLAIDQANQLYQQYLDIVQVAQSVLPETEEVDLLSERSMGHPLGLIIKTV
jgi:hypothetical protein